MHLTDLEIEGLRAGETAPAARTHIDGCARCQDRLDTLRGLAAALSAAPAVAIPPAQDASLLAAAAQRAGQIARSRRRIAIAVAAPALAAAATLLILFTRPAHRPAGALDVNRDGQVDILDAFALSRALDARATRPDWDFNHDGVVDHGDVQLVAHRVVSVDQKGGG